MTEDTIAETKRGEFKVIEGSGLRTEMDTHTRQQEMPRVHKRRLEHHAPTNRYRKYCRHTTLNICVSPVSCRYSSATGGTDLPTHLAIFAICISTVLLQLLACRLIPCSSRESVFIKLALQGTRDLGSKLPSPTEVDTSASANVPGLADAPSRSPTELVESISLEEGSHLTQTVSTLPDKQLPVEILDEYLFQSEDQEVEEYF